MHLKKYVGELQYVMHVYVYPSAYYLYTAYFQKGVKVGGFAGSGPAYNATFLVFRANHK